MDLCQADKVRDAEFFGPSRLGDSGLVEQFTNIDVQGFQAGAQHFTALAKCGLGDFGKTCKVDFSPRSALGRSCTTADVTLGGGVNALR